MSKYRNMVATLLLVCAVAAFVLAVNASSASAASISGHVRDQDNKPVPQAIVTLYFNRTIVDIAGNPAHTDANGSYKFTNVPLKIYGVEFEKNSYTYSETVTVNVDEVVVNATLPGHTAALVTTPSPVPTPKPSPTPSPTPTASPTATPSPTPAASPTARPSPGFGILIGLAGFGLAMAARKR